MATLSGNITATQRSIRVSDGAAVTPGLRVRVDDELIDFIRFEPYPYINGVRQKGLDATRWVVTRGVADSVAASHLSGATLTAAVQASVSSETLAPPDPFADAGGEQTIRLLGPFVRTAAQVNAGTDVAPGKKLNLVAIEANVLVVRAWAFFTGGWVGTNPDPAKVTIGVDLESDEFDMVDAIRYESVGEVLATNGHTEDEGLLGTTNTGANQVVRRTAGGNLYIYAEGATSGTAEVYALIAEPSA
jgi:hypothetical protein